MLDAKDVIALTALLVSGCAFGFSVFKGRYDQIVGIKPALVFVYDSVAGWELQNIGAGPALNIVVVKSEGSARSASARWIQPVRVPPMRRDGKASIHWDRHNNANAFGAVYEDMWGRLYTTTCARDLNVIARGASIRSWTEADVQAEWGLRELGEASRD